MRLHRRALLSYFLASRLPGIPGLMSEPRGRERYHIARVLLVAKEETAFPEGGTPKGEGDRKSVV